MSMAGLAIAASVLMHVAWNLMARHQPHGVFVLWWILLAHLVLLGPWGLYTLVREVEWTTKFAAWLLISATANAVYFIALRRAYEFAPVAFVYPLARSSPFLIALWSVLFASESLRKNEWIGIAVSVIGLLLMARTGHRENDGRALPYALTAMIATSIYSLTDKAAAAHIPSFGGLVGFITVGYCASWAVLALDSRRSTGAWIPRGRPPIAVIIAGGLCVGLAYALVIHAMRSLPSAVVVSYTNAGIVIATCLSIFVFKERSLWKTRLVAALTISAGLLALGR